MPTVCRGAGPFLRSAPWQRHLCPGTWVHLASAGLQHRGPHRPGLAASPVAHWSRTPGPYPACGRRAPPAPQGPSSTLPPGHSQAGFPLRPRAAHRPHSAARPSRGAEGRHYPAQTSFLTSPQYCFPPIARLCSGDRAKANLPAVAEASTEACSRPSLHPGTPGLQRGSRQPTATPARANPPCVEEGLKATGAAHLSPSHFSSAARPWARSHSCCGATTYGGHAPGPPPRASQAWCGAAPPTHQEEGAVLPTALLRWEQCHKVFK